MTTKALEQVFRECKLIIDQLAYYSYKDVPDDSCRISIMCRIYYALIDSHEGCNALGNNLAQAMEDVKEFVELGPRSCRMETDVRDYLLRRYLVSERIYEAMRIVGLCDPKFVLATDGMRALREVKQWANFFKHPGAFLWCHDPQFYCLSLGQPPVEASLFVVDQKVVDEYYKDDQKKHARLHDELSNETCVQVHFPELVELTRRFCKGVDEFCTTLSAPIFRDILKRKSTIDDYFASDQYACQSSAFDVSSSEYKP